MKGIAVTTIVALVLIVLVLTTMSVIFLMGLQMSPLEARKTFAAGCVNYCSQIQNTAQATGERLEIVAVRLGENLKGSQFINSCNVLFPETKNYPYLCWNRNCCSFTVPLP